MTKQERTKTALQNEKIANWLQITNSTVRSCLKHEPKTVTALLVHQCKERLENNEELYDDIDIVREFAKTIEGLNYSIDIRKNITFIDFTYKGKRFGAYSLGSIYAINQFLDEFAEIKITLEQPKNMFNLLNWSE